MTLQRKVKQEKYKPYWVRLLSNQQNLQLHSEVFLEKLIVAWLIKKFPTFYATWWFTTISQDLTTGPYLQPNESSPQPPILFLLRSILILSSHLNLCLPSGLFPSGTPTGTLHTFLFIPTWPTCPALSQQNLQAFLFSSQQTKTWVAYMSRQ